MPQICHAHCPRSSWLADLVAVAAVVVITVIAAEVLASVAAVIITSGLALVTIGCARFWWTVRRDGMFLRQERGPQLPRAARAFPADPVPLALPVRQPLALPAARPYLITDATRLMRPSLTVLAGTAVPGRQATGG